MLFVCHREGPGGDTAESDKASDRCCFGFVWEFDRKPALSRHGLCVFGPFLPHFDLQSKTTHIFKGGAQWVLRFTSAVCLIPQLNNS